jgi:GMP synthase-like glutamine amidotransferase
MNVLVVDNGTRYLPQLRQLLAEHRVRTVAFGQLAPRDEEWAGLIILSGGHRFPVMGHLRRYEREIKMIRSTDKSLIGLCLGFELMVVALGGRLKWLPRAVHAQVQVQLASGVLGGRSHQVYENHHWGVQHLPSELVAVGHSGYGVEIVRHATRPQYGFQFHPEMSGYGAQLIARAIEELRT